jgi:hypothetical protein
MAGIAGSQAAIGLAQSYSESKAIKAQGDYQKAMFDLNSSFSDMQAQQSLRRGDASARSILRKTRSLVGSQRAVLAAQGIDVDSGSAIDITEDSRVLGEMDALTVKNNAWMEAWGFRSQAEIYRSQGRMAQAESRSKARNTLIAGAFGAISKGGQAAGYAAGGGSSGGGSSSSAAPSGGYGGGGSSTGGRAPTERYE